MYIRFIYFSDNYTFYGLYILLSGNAYFVSILKFTELDRKLSLFGRNQRYLSNNKKRKTLQNSTTLSRSNAMVWN